MALSGLRERFLPNLAEFGAWPVRRADDRKANEPLGREASKAFWRRINQHHRLYERLLVLPLAAEWDVDDGHLQAVAAAMEEMMPQLGRGEER